MTELCGIGVYISSLHVGELALCLSDLALVSRDLALVSGDLALGSGDLAFGTGDLAFDGRPLAFFLLGRGLSFRGDIDRSLGFCTMSVRHRLLGACLVNFI